MKTGLENLLATRNKKRLSISDIHWLWNTELHQNSGHKPYQPETVTSGNDSEHDDMLAAFERFKDICKRDTWLNSAGNKAKDSDVQGQLIAFIADGHLPVYESKNPGTPASTPEELKGVNLPRKSATYFIDRNDLGCLLVEHGRSLPSFWYAPAEEAIFQDRLKRQADAGISERHHMETLIEENRKLKAELNNARPFMDTEHPFFSVELEAAVEAWLVHYSDKEPNYPALAKRPKLENWLKENRPKVALKDTGLPNVNALERISKIANPAKAGGRPRKGR
ncbi:MAG: hypothetical protein ABW148_00425 [Sedimenticola sp.]